MLQALQMLMDEVAGVLMAGAMEGTGGPWPGAVVVAGAGMTTGGSLLPLVALAWLPRGQQAKLQRLMDRFGHQAVLWALSMVAIRRFAGDQLGDLTVLVQPYVLPVTLGLAGAALALIGWRWRRQRAAALEA